MSLDWILSPITQYSVLVVGLIACLGMCVSTGVRMRSERRRMTQSYESLDHTVAALSNTVEQMRRDTSLTETHATAQLQGLNLTRRAQALRMHRRGEAITTIAAALRSPQNEIELLLKVHGYLNS